MNDTRDAAVAHYMGRRGAFVRLLTEGYPDEDDGDLCRCPECVPFVEQIEQAVRILGAAMEGEVFPCPEMPLETTESDASGQEPQYPAGPATDPPPTPDDGPLVRRAWNPSHRRIRWSSG